MTSPLLGRKWVVDPATGKRRWVLRDKVPEQKLIEERPIESKPAPETPAPSGTQPHVEDLAREPLIEIPKSPTVDTGPASPPVFDPHLLTIGVSRIHHMVAGGLRYPGFELDAEGQQLWDGLWTYIIKNYLNVKNLPLFLLLAAMMMYYSTMIGGYFIERPAHPRPLGNAPPTSDPPPAGAVIAYHDGLPP